MARNKKSVFNVTDGLDFGTIPTQDVQEAQQVQEVREVQQVQEVKKDIGTTQGKKGFKLKRINMAFSDSNYEYITKESRMQGLSSTAFVNIIIEEYKKTH